MPERTQQLVYVVDDDQGMLDSTVWLFESMGLKALPLPMVRRFLMPAIPPQRPVSCLMCVCPEWVGWPFRTPCASEG